VTTAIFLCLCTSDANQWNRSLFAQHLIILKRAGLFDRKMGMRHLPFSAFFHFPSAHALLLVQSTWRRDYRTTRKIALHNVFGRTAWKLQIQPCPSVIQLTLDERKVEPFTATLMPVSMFSDKSKQVMNAHSHILYTSSVGFLAITSICVL